MKCNVRFHTVRGVVTGLLLLAVLTMGACVKKIVQPPLEVTFLPQKGEFISKDGDRVEFAAIVDMARDKDYILVGEGHTSLWDHKVQQRLVTALAATDRPPSIGLEMVAVDKQVVLDDFGKGQVDIPGLEEELQWSKRWGYPFSLFKGLFEVAQRNSLPVVALNMPTAVTKKITKDGLDALSEEEHALLPTTIVPASDEQKAFLDMIYSQHSGKDADNATQRERFDLVQSIWDSKMAEEAVRVRRKYDWPVVVIAGSGHVENGWGIARRIAQFDPGAKILLVMPWRGGEFDAKSGDVFFYSPETYESKMGASLTATGFGGLLVEGVKRDSRAEKAGLRPGDTLVEAAGIPLDYLMSLHMAGSRVHEADAELIFTVRRGGEIFKANVGKLGVPKAKAEPAKQPVEKEQ